jgi:hypothetical protein
MYDFLLSNEKYDKSMSYFIALLQCYALKDRRKTSKKIFIKMKVKTFLGNYNIFSIKCILIGNFFAVYIGNIFISYHA